MELLPGEQLLRVHRSRFLKTSGCGLSSISLVVEEALENCLSAIRPRRLYKLFHPKA